LSQPYPSNPPLDYYHERANLNALRFSIFGAELSGYNPGQSHILIITRPDVVPTIDGNAPLATFEPTLSKSVA
jgi:hypothetical protein